MQIRFHPIPTETARALQAGAPDANGQPPERAISDGAGNPCRHCLRNIPAGAGMLILALRPFSALQPYAECGPVFLCEEACAPWPGDSRPPIFADGTDYLLRGYTPGERICYGTGRIVAGEAIEASAAELLARPEVAFVDIRSARNNCFQARIFRAGEGRAG